MTLPLFATEETDDVCARKHHHNPQSAEAFLQGHKSADAEKVFAFLASCGEKGATLDEISVAFGRAAHCLSGRLTSLHEAGRIYRKPGAFRKTRTGSRAAVWMTA